MDKIKVCLDAGHYGKYNRSPVLAGYYESDMVWKLHLYLKEELEAVGFEVITTRKEQARDLSVYNRGLLAKGCHLFLSLHSNACDTQSVDYPVTYRAYDNAGNSDHLGLKLAQGISQIMGTRQAGRTATRRNSSGGEYYGVLRGARAVGLTDYYIVEHSFHTNLAATKWLSDDGNLRQMAKMEAGIIADYYGVKAPVPEPETGIRKGSRVKVSRAVQYNGKPFKVWYPTYEVMSLTGDRAVIGVNGVVTAAVHVRDLTAV